MIRSKWTRWGPGVALALVVAGAPYLYYRITFEYQKRLRIVTPGKMYRSGCMTAQGLDAAIKTYGIRTVINLMEEAPDPDLHSHYFAPARVKERAVVERNGARYIALTVTYLPRSQAHTERPATIERYLEILDDPRSYPVLVHCKAGLHRTGIMIAVYRMEYEGWSRQQALAEIRRHGFGEFASTASNEYVQQYVLSYVPHQRPRRHVERLPRTPGTLVSQPAAGPEDGFAPLPKD